LLRTYYQLAAVLADTVMTIEPCYYLFRLDRYTLILSYINYVSLTSNIAFLAKPTRTIDDFAKGMTFLPNIDA
jgi:hypothetical protein